MNTHDKVILAPLQPPLSRAQSVWPQHFATGINGSNHANRGANANANVPLPLGDG